MHKPSVVLTNRRLGWTCGDSNIEKGRRKLEEEGTASLNYVHVSLGGWRIHVNNMDESAA